jgi:hypothetical protein
MIHGIADGEVGARVSRLSFFIVCVLGLAGCASSHVMIGKARPPISPDMVQIYMRPPTTHYEEIAQLDTSSQGSFSFTAQAKTDAVIRRLKAEAAKLGANGVILQGIGNQSSGSVGTGGGSESYSGGGSFGGGIGINLETTRKIGGGVAIFVDAR